MNKIVYIAQQYITKIVLIPLCIYAYLTWSCPACQHRIEPNSPFFFTTESIPDEPIVAIEIENIAQEEAHA